MRGLTFIPRIIKSAEQDNQVLPHGHPIGQLSDPAREVDVDLTDDRTVRSVAPWSRFVPRCALRYQIPRNRDSGESYFDKGRRIRHLRRESTTCQVCHKDRTKEIEFATSNGRGDDAVR